LDAYRENVLQPFFFPPLKAFFSTLPLCPPSHPSLPPRYLDKQSTRLRVVQKAVNGQRHLKFKGASRGPTERREGREEGGQLVANAGVGVAAGAAAAGAGSRPAGGCHRRKGEDGRRRRRTGRRRRRRRKRRRRRWRKRREDGGGVVDLVLGCLGFDTAKSGEGEGEGGRRVALACCLVPLYVG